ncbi:MAG: hypothetical protein V9H26_17700 [Verrucomicrobiota bacterium]
MKEYILKPIMTRPTLNLTTTLDKPAVVRPVPPRQPLPKAVMDPTKPMLKLGLDVHLEFIMVVAQKDHAHPHAPRQFTRAGTCGPSPPAGWPKASRSSASRKVAALASCSIANSWPPGRRVF